MFIFPYPKTPNVTVLRCYGVMDKISTMCTTLEKVEWFLP